MIQDGLSGVTLSVPLLARMAREVPQLSYFKIECAGDGLEAESIA